MKCNDIYLAADMGHSGGMAAPRDIVAYPPCAAHEGVRRRGLAVWILAMTIAAAPAHAEIGQRFNLSGIVIPRCSAGAPPALDLGGIAEAPGALIRSGTVRCSGPNPILTVKTRALTNSAAILTTRDADGQTRSARAGTPLPEDAGARLGAGDGNVRIDLASGTLSDPKSSGDDSGGAVEITVSPAI